MRIGSVFSGIGGIDRGLELAGVGHVAWQCEIDDYARRVLRRHWPWVPIYGDVRHLARGARARREQSCDLLVGGPPCQDVSVAGRGAGMAPDTRSGLWWEYLRVVRTLRPPLVFAESPARSRGRWLPTVTSSLAAVGYRWAYVCVRACDLGYHHERDRVFVLAADAHCPRLEVAEPVVVEDQREAIIGAHTGPDKPGVGRVAYGVPHRVDRIRCLGNTVIPEQAAEAFRQLVQVVRLWT